MKLGPRYKIQRIEAAQKAAKTRKNKPHTYTHDVGTVVPMRDTVNPLAVAFEVLNGRLVEKPSGYFLDGNPANLTIIMKAANMSLVKRGLEQIRVNPAWVIENS